MTNNIRQSNNNSGIILDLSSFADRFVNESREFSLTKHVNFIFGKNGTGKTTITDQINKQLSEKYKVSIFKDFEGIVGENKRLKAIALGTENTEIQEKINTVDKEILDIEKEVSESLEDGANNLFTKFKTAEKEFEFQNNNIKKFYSNSASHITKECNLGRNYNTNNFQSDIKSAKLLSDDEIKKYNEIIKSEKKQEVNITHFTNIDLSAYLKVTNEILHSKVEQQQIIKELQDNSDKQNFARKGIEIHKQGEECAFCGNVISSERWELLGNYFNTEVKKLEQRINDEISKIDTEIEKLNNIKEIDTNSFYTKFSDQIESLNQSLRNIISAQVKFLDSIKLGLKNKRLFVKSCG